LAFGGGSLDSNESVLVIKATGGLMSPFVIHTFVAHTLYIIQVQ